MGSPNLSMLPSDYMKRQCWISFDPDEAMLRMTAESALVGADRIIWASDYPHPDAKFPGVTEELAEALDGLAFEQKRQVTSETASRPLRHRLVASCGTTCAWFDKEVRRAALGGGAVLRDGDKALVAWLVVSTGLGPGAGCPKVNSS